MLTQFRWCIYVALWIDPQLVVSIRQKANQARRSLEFHRVLLAESKHKRSSDGDLESTQNCESHENCVFT